MDARRERYSQEWTEEDEQKHPRDHGKWAKKGEGEASEAHPKIKLIHHHSDANNRHYVLADLPNGSLVSHSDEDLSKAIESAHKSIRMQGFEPEEKPDQELEDPHKPDAKPPEKPKEPEAPKAKVKITMDNFGGKRWYALADLPGGRQVTRSHEDKAEAHRLASDEVRAAGHEPEGLDSDEPSVKPPEKPREPSEPERPKTLYEVSGDEGMSARVFTHKDGFSVTLHDSDAGETVPAARIFPTLERAKEFADTVRPVHEPETIEPVKSVAPAPVNPHHEWAKQQISELEEDIGPLSTEQPSRS